MKLKRIGTKIILMIIPIFLLAQGVLTGISAISSGELVDEKTTDNMFSQLEYNKKRIDGCMDEIVTMSNSISVAVANTYNKTNLKEYEKMLEEMIQTNSMVLGSGLWFEPYAYDKKEQYVGPYVYKDGDKITTTYDYSNAEYNYFEQEYYLISKESNSAVFTDPYYDETSNITMASCSAPILVDGKFIGCVTVDISLESIKTMVDEVVVGRDGRAMLVTTDGTYLGGVPEEKISSAVKITEDENASLATIGQTIVQGEKGNGSFEEAGEEYRYYYDSVDILNWKFILKMPKYELMKPILNLINKLIVACIVAVVIAIVIIIIQVGGISKSIIRVQIFAKELADGNFAINALDVKGNDELANMTNSLNEMYGSNKDIIMNIAKESKSISTESVKLNESVDLLKTQFENISEFMASVNEAMMNASAATEEVSASVEQVNQATEVLADETNSSLKMVEEIKIRANEIEKNSRESYETAKNLREDYQEKLKESISKAKVVENIGELARIISDIAEQITLLSLNASIEAARAGEQGRGFAVVASEIGKLAGETADAVGRIQSTIQDVQGAFEGLATNTNVLLDFVSDTVTPDYENFVDVSIQYGKDAELIDSSSNQISKMSMDIMNIMNEITNAIQSIAQSTQETADSGAQILDAVDDVSEVVKNVDEMSQNQKNISDNLSGMVQKFRLDV